MKHKWFANSDEITVAQLRERLADLPDDWLIRPTEFGYHARAATERPDYPLILSSIELGVVESWGWAAHGQNQLSDHEDILLSKVQAMKRSQEYRDAKERCECPCHRGKQCDHPVTQEEPNCVHCGKRAPI